MNASSRSDSNNESREPSYVLYKHIVLEMTSSLLSLVGCWKRVEIGSLLLVTEHHLFLAILHGVLAVKSSYETSQFRLPRHRHKVSGCKREDLLFAISSAIESKRLSLPSPPRGPYQRYHTLV